jgi:hypothetical protein
MMGLEADRKKNNEEIISPDETDQWNAGRFV